MGTTEWTIIGTGIALLAVLAPLIGFTNSSTKSELKFNIAELRTELKGDIGELKGDIAELLTELKGDIAGLRVELAQLRTDMLSGDTSLRAAMQEGEASLRAELKADIAALRIDVQANRVEIITNRRMLGRFALHRHGDDGLPLAPLTDTLDPPEGAGESAAQEDDD